MDAFVQRAVADADGDKRVCLDTSATGRIYVLNAAGRIWSTDGRLLQMEMCKQCMATCLKPAVETKDVRFQGSSMHVSAGGDFILVRGNRHDVVKDVTYAALLLVDVGASRPLQVPDDAPLDAAKAAASQAEKAWDGVSVVVDYQEAYATFVDESQLSLLPGLELFQVAWHPGSAAHFGVLKSDNSFSIFSVRNASAAEQRYQLRTSRQVFRLSAAVAENPSLRAQRAIDFCFGIGMGWEAFAVYFLFQDGSLYALCPVAPFGMPVRMMLVHHLTAGCEGSRKGEVGEGVAQDSTTTAWLQAITGLPDLLDDSAPGRGWREHERNEYLTIPVQPHALPGCCPVLQGPLADSDDAGESRITFSRLLVASTDPGVDATRTGSVTVVLAVGTSAGAAHLVSHLALDDVLPHWQRGTIKYMSTEDGASIRATNMEVSPSQSPRTCELSVRDSVTLPCRRAAAGDAAHGSDDDAWGHDELWIGCCGPQRAIMRVGGQLWDVQLPWVNEAATWLDHGPVEWPDSIDLTPVVVNPILVFKADDEPQSDIVSCALLRHVLTDDSLATVDRDGSAVLLALNAARPLAPDAADTGGLAASSPLGSPPQTPPRPSPARDHASPAAVALAQNDLQLRMDEAVACAYRRVMVAPSRPAGLARDAAAAGSTEGAINALNAAIEALSQRYMKHIYTGYADLYERLKVVAATLQNVGAAGHGTAGEEADGAEAQSILAAQEQLTQVQESNVQLERRLSLCKQVQNILDQRCQLLTTILLLNVNQPGDLNDAEVEFEAEVGACQGELADMRKQVQALVQQLKDPSSRERMLAAAKGSGAGAARGRTAQPLLATSLAELREVIELEAGTREALKRLQRLA